MSVLKWVGGLLLALILALLAWGILIEPRFLLDVRSFEAKVPNLPPAWEGRTVAVMADFQVGMWFDNPGMVEKTVDEILEAEAELVLIAGDFVYHADSAIVREVVSLIRPLAEADLPVLAVLGNHDYSLASDKDEPRLDMARYLEAELEAAGVRVLENEVVPVTLSPGEDPLHVVGLGSVWADRSRPEVALANLPSDVARVVLIHNPIAFRDLPPETAPLTTAGHTHGGQLRLPLTPSEAWLDIARPREVVADGWAADSIGATGNRLYVNRGIGFSVVPMRIRCRPELTLFTLRRAHGTMHEREPGTEPSGPKSDSNGA